MNFDLCIITAANESQAQGYREQLRWRRENRLLPRDTKFFVIADPEDQRIGSGSSTIFVLFQLVYEHGLTLEGKRTLILHSGGDSRRLPAFSALGKIFLPIPSRRYFALFDALLDNLSQFPVQPEGQVIVASGDVLLTFDPALVTFTFDGITGMAYPGEWTVAKNHGVYVVGDGQVNPRPVGCFLQKPTREEMLESGALDLYDRAFVDTGILNFSMPVVFSLLKQKNLYKKIISKHLYLDIYKEFVFAILGQGWLPGADLGKIPFHVCTLPYCGFFHIGTSLQLLQNVNVTTDAGVQYQFENFAGSRTAVQGLKQIYVYNSDIKTEHVYARQPVLVSGCTIGGQLELAGENILTHIPEYSGDLKLKQGICLAMVPLKGKMWAAVIYGLRDNFKNSAADGTFLNTPLDKWMEKFNITSSQVWPGKKERIIWEARLFPVGRSFDSVLKTALFLQWEKTAAWKAAKKLSMAEILARADFFRLGEYCAALYRRGRIFDIGQGLEEIGHVPTSHILAWCKTESDFEHVFNSLARLFELYSQPLQRARTSQIISALHKKYNKPIKEIFHSGFYYVKEAVEQSLDKSEDDIPVSRLAIREDEVVWVCAPARLDFAGGWSDTPPYCFEHGGCVLNAAVRLNGQYPIQVIGKRLEKPVLRINSIDLGVSCVIEEAESIYHCEDPSDWCSLPKAALIAAGIIPENKNLFSVLEKYGGGMDLTLFSAVPSGSGLGTSSILGAAVLCCLYRMFGVTLSKEELYRRTLLMEQLLSTGGGWQDQIGGVVGGVKLIQTANGLKQSPNISWTSLCPPGTDFSQRYLLYYTGYRRLAKNILQEIVGRYLDRDPDTLHAITELKQQALRMKDQLDRRDAESFGLGIKRVWELNKKLDEHSSNKKIEEILSVISKNVLGAKLLGAGGGGFLFIVTRGLEQSRRIRKLLEKNPPNNRARFFNFEIDVNGLTTSVL
ncbi:hypothetical protein JW935_20945 [candidate division KSB1 bacterium]|nr:hypothetical protein [candidate division KSB1 bacterium]